MSKKRETIFVFSAHNDDFVLGAGGTIAEYVKEGKEIFVVVFSYGVNSHPWLKEDVVKEMRVEETQEACKILGCRSKFFDLKELKFKESFDKQGVENKLLKILEKKKPTKIFTHSGEDPHPDHQAVHTISMQLWEKMKHKPEIYTYSVWNPVSFKTRFASLYVNISKSFSVKLRAMKTFQSQKVHVAYPVVLLFWRAIKNGLKMRTKFGEQFYRLK